MPPDFNPLAYSPDLAVRDVTVTLRDGGTTRRFLDTLLPRFDSSRYSTPLQSYVLRNFVPEPGRAYRIDASSSVLGTASGTMVMPTRSYIDLGAGSLAILDSPSSYAAGSTIACVVIVSSGAGGFLGHFYVDYDVLVGSEWQEGRAEIPLRFIYHDLKSLEYVLYPQLTSRPSRNMASLIFANETYQLVLSSLTNDRFKGKKLIFKWAVFQITQLDKNLYNYYQAVHFYRDAKTIRLDEPMYSNVSGGYGLVGAYTLDSLVHLFPENFSFNNR